MPRGGGRPVFALLFVLLLHAALFSSVRQAGQTEHVYLQPQGQGQGGSGLVSAAEPVMTLIHIPDCVRGEESDETLASRGEKLTRGVFESRSISGP